MATLQDRAKKPKLLVLFHGTGSVERAVLEQFPGGEITTVDLEEKWKPTHCRDISDWVGMDRDTSGRSPMRAYRPRCFDVLWVSPHCTEY